MDKIRTIRAVKGFLIFVIALLVCSAHDFYLLPDKFFLSKGETLDVHLYVGDEFKTEEEKPFQKYITKKYLWISPDKTEDMISVYKDSTFPVMKKVMETQGLGIIAMERSYARIKLSPEKFTSYLKEEKLDNILKMRDTMAPKKEEREKYTRYLKALVMVDNAKGKQYRTQLGHALEIILLDNPYLAKKGDFITAQLFFKGKPLHLGSVEIICKDKEEKIYVEPIKTDKTGKVKFKMDKSGSWLIRITHMIPCENCNDADWESFWASYSFGVK